MERNPVRFVWRSTRVLHAGTFAALLLAIPILWTGIDLVRVAVDDAIAGRAFTDQRTAPFLRFVLALPDRIAEQPIVFFRGIALDRPAFVLATIAALVVIALIASVGTLLFGGLRSGIGSQALDRLR